MKRNNYYIQAPASEINIKIHEGKPLPPMPKAKRSEVPPMYRKSIRKMVLNGILYAFFALSMLNCILFFATVL